MQHNTEVINWLEKFKEPVIDNTPTKSSPAESPLLILSIQRQSPSPLIIDSMIARHLIKGGLGSPRKFSPSKVNPERIPENLYPAYALLSFSSNSNHFDTQFILENIDIMQILTPFLDANMVYFADHRMQIKAGPPISLELSWETESDGRQYIKSNSTLFIIKGTPYVYIDPISKTIGILESPIPHKTIEMLLKSPGLFPSDTKIVTKTLKKLTNVPTPKTFEQTITRQVDPITCLHLVTYEHGNYYSSPRSHYCGDITFQYDGVQIHPLDPRSTIEQLNNGILEKIQRNPKKEKTDMAFIRSLALSMANKQTRNPNELATVALLGSSVDHDKSAENITKLVEILRREKWKVTFSQDFPVSDILEIEDWYSELNETSDYQWFSMELGVIIDGKKVSLLEPLLAVLAQKNIAKLLEKADNPKHRTVIAFDNKKLSLPTNRLAAVLHLIAELHRKKEGVFQIAKSRAGLLIEMEKAFSATQMRWLGDTQLVELGQKLQTLSWPKISVPNSFHATLRPYQEEGVRWLQFLREQQLGGILADDMGLGKTVQTLAHIMIEKENGRLKNPCLIIAPTSVISNWKDEAQRFAPTLRILVLHGLNRHTSFEDISSHDLILSTYPLLIRDVKVLLSHRFSLIVLDEAHTIKNAQAKMTQIALQLKADSRICLTGTPMENHLGELWSLFHFLMPGFLGHKQYFQSNYRTPIEKQKNPEARDYLSQKLKPFILRRNKSTVAQDLPEKTEIQRHIVFEEAQRDLYESIRLSMHQKVKDAISEQGIERSQIMILDALLKLRQVCCDPRLVKVKKTNTDIPSAKLQHLLEMLPTLLEEGRRILLFSQFTSMFTLIEPELTKLKIPYLKLTGDTQNRGELVTQFQEGNIPLFLISLKAGGTGLNLTAADTVIHYDPWWNPAVEAQATDRAHRIGQTSAVFVYKLITEGTVEEKILDMQHKKRNLVDSILSGGTMQSLMTMDDVEALFRG